MSTKQPLGHIDKVRLRDIWPHEAHDFTKWLSEEENLALLGETIGIDLELIETESSVGSFNADIFAFEVGTTRKIIIENQLEDTNHDHLGKIITYAAGKDAEVIIWIVAHARDEHRQAIEWLNEHTDSDFAFFLLEIEVWKIGDSAPAPRFNIVERPNDWTKSVKLSNGLTDTQKLYLQYWQELTERALDNRDFSQYLNCQSPSYRKYLNLAVGSSQYYISLLLSTMYNTVGIQVYVPNNKSIVHKLHDEIDTFSAAVGHRFEAFESTKTGGIKCLIENCDIKNNSDKWNEYIDWQLNAAVKVRKVLADLNLN